ncbi:MAG: pyridoxal phosphate-dependent decarboxylase family protein [Acidimicrobiales bacterium]
MSTRRALLRQTADLAADFLEGLPKRPVRARATHAELLTSLGGALPEDGEAAGEVVADLASAADPGLIASAGPRYFGFVIGGSLPAALAADWLTSAWDQNAGLYACSPAASVVEEVAAAWLLELLDLPRSAAVGFVTGCQMANATCLAAARHAVLERAGWNVEQRGLQGAPRVHVVVGDEAHVTIFSSLRFLGLGAAGAVRVPADGQGRLRADALATALAACDGPTIVCAQAGNVNTGAFDPLPEIVTLAHERGAWVHVDGAFGLWARATTGYRALATGIEGVDSWATDAHKWLNVPYDSGVAIVAEAGALQAAMAADAAYLIKGKGEVRDEEDWVPEFSRRARGFPIYAALRSLGRRGVAQLVDRCCALARRMAERLGAAPGVEVLNDVVLNQVLVRFGDDDAVTRRVIERVQADGTCWLSGTTWHGRAALRISVSNWSTTEADADRSVDAILKARLQTSEISRRA